MRRKRRSSSPGSRSRGLHYQVYAGFSFLEGRPQLVKTSISSIHKAGTTFPINPLCSSLLTISRIFTSLKIAHSYIAYLHGVNPDSPAPPSVLDGGQHNLFSEVSI